MKKFTFAAWMLSAALFSQPFLVTLGVCQETGSKQTAEVKIWKARVDNLEDNIRKDSKFIDESERPFYFALFAKVLWKYDPAEGRLWLKAASNAVLSDLNFVEKNEIAKKLKWAQKTVQIIASVDSGQAKPLLERIAKFLESNGGDSKTNADSFVSIGLQVLDSDPRLAYDLGVRSLSYANSPELFRLIFALNLKDSTLAGQLFQLSLAAARSNPDNQFIGSLDIVFLVRQGKAFSDEARRSYLELLADLMANVVLSESERATRCTVSDVVTPVLDKFDEYLPDRAQAVKQELQLCLAISSPAPSEKNEDGGDDPKSSDELLSAARNTDDRSKKASYFYRAITVLASQKKYSEIISILDDLRDNEKAAIGETAWDSWRIEYTTEAVLAAFSEKDLPTVYQTIEHTPKRLRPYVRFRFVYKLSPVVDKDLFLDNLEGIKKELGSFDAPTSTSPNSYLNLAKLYLKVQPTESGELLHNAAKAINVVDLENPDFLPEKDWAPLDDYVNVPAGFLEVDEYAVFSALTDISSRRSRVRLELGLLESALKKLDDAKVSADMEKKGTKK